MAITIRNKQLEADIRALGAEMGKGPTDVPRALVSEAQAQAEVRKQAEYEALVARRKAATADLMARAREIFTEEVKADMERAMDEMYDDDGLPR